MGTMPPREIKKIEKHLVDLISNHIGKQQNEIEVNLSFKSMGLSKKDFIVLAKKIEDEFGKRISPTIFFEKSTVKLLTEYIVGMKIERYHNKERIKRQYNQYEPIAVVGMACRFPGAENIEEYWDVLSNGIDRISEIPESRWDSSIYNLIENDNTSKKYAHCGGFIKDVDAFDTNLFGISRTEALHMDPQQRILLEVCWEAIENANYAPDSLANSNTGVYVGIHNNDYMRMNLSDIGELTPYSVSGGEFSIASGRISYQLGLLGPSMAIDTACSSSLMTVHLACQSLRMGECDMALAGGVNLILAPEFNIALSKARMLSKTGKCHTFDSSADGYVRSEGCGMIVLKRLSDAIESKDNILGIIRGSAVKQDGRSNGLTAPNKASQEAVIREALFNSGVSPLDVQYIEAHGTGTELGDPIELEALKSVFCDDRNIEDSLIVGSSKTNIGHMETAAGIGGLIKTILMIKNKTIPAHLNFNNPNPHFLWENTPIKIPVITEPWEKSNGLRIAGVSSFGFSGTNVHIIVEEAPSMKDNICNIEKESYLITLSAASEKALKTLAEQYVRYLDLHPEVSIADFCYTANTARANLPYRTAFIGESCEEIKQKLYEFYNDESCTDINRVIGGRQPEIVFLFTGQESAYLGIARELYDKEKVFRGVINKCSERLEQIHAFDGKSILMAINSNEINEEFLQDTLYIQPLFFSIQYALVELYKSWGIEPSIVMGHSAGEYAAACAAGMMDWMEGLNLITERGRILKSISGKGSMITVFEGEQEVEDIISNGNLNVEIAVINGGKNTVVSGNCEEIQNFCNVLIENNIEYRTLSKSNGFHSYMVDSCMNEFETYSQKVKFKECKIDYISNIDGMLWSDGKLLDAKYWCRHMRSPVQFLKGVKTILDNEYRVFIEIGPSATLTKIVNYEFGDIVSCLPSVCKENSNWITLLNVLGMLFKRGALVDWSNIDRIRSNHVKIPTYPFERLRYWRSSTKGFKEAATTISDKLEVVNNDKLESFEPQESLLTFKIVNSTGEEQLQLIEKYLCLHIGRVLGCTIFDKDIVEHLSFMGFDSLMAIRIRNRIQTDFGYVIKVAELMGNASIKSLKKLLAEWFINKSKANHCLIPKVTRDGELFPLSLSQRQLWLLQQMDKSTSAYNLPVAFRIKGNVNSDILQKAFDIIVERHEILRTRYVSIEGTPWQNVVPPEPVDISVVSLCNTIRAEVEKRAKDILVEESKRSFNLAIDPLLRVKLIKIDEDESIMLIHLHHIVADGWSLLEVLLRELNILYGAFSTASTPILSKLPIQYIDYAYWQQNNENDIKYDESISYWKEKLVNAEFEPFFPTDYARPTLTAHKGKRNHYCLPRKLVDALETFSKKRKVTLFVTLLTGFKALLFRWTGEKDIIIGTTVANRMFGEIENLIGDFTNHIPLRTFVSPESSFDQLLEKVQNNVVEAFTHSNCPLENILEFVNVERKDNRNPLYSIAFVMHTFSNRSGNIKIGPLEARLLTPLAQVDNETSEMDMIFELLENEEGLMISCEFDTEIFNDNTINQFMDSYRVLLEGLIKNSECIVENLEIVSEQHKNRIISQWNRQDIEYPVNKCIHEIFEERVESNPNSIALVYEGRHMTYKELNGHANKLASRLLEIGAGRGALVGICTERSLEMVIAILGILKSGSAYIALDPAYPQGHISYILEDSAAKYVVAQKTTKDYVASKQETLIICIDAEDTLEEEDYIAVESNSRPEDLAYVLYTSGSTGNPKGALITHYNVVRLFSATDKWFKFNKDDVWTLFHSYAFDFSVWELWGSLLYGGKLVIIPYLVSRAPEDFYSLLVKEKVTVLNQTPSAFRQLVGIDMQKNNIDNLSLRFIIFGGEALDIKMLNPWISRHGIEKPKLINMYGITETTVHVTYKEITNESKEKGLDESIGISIPDLQVHILDSNQKLLPPGAIGEICVGGAGVAKGYLNRPELTDDRFIPNKFTSKIGDKLYRSGDLGRYLPNGEVQYIGRLDSQVKVRGFRIELGQIESVLKQHSEIDDSIVQIWEPSKDDRRLVAYIVPKLKSDKSEDKLIGEDSEKVSQWQTVFDETYGQETVGLDPTFNIIGWNSSYTGEAIPMEEMYEWLEETIQFIRELKPKKVLELGCGTGMILFRLATECTTYVGTDISNVGLEYIKRQIEKNKWKLPQVNLIKKSADDLKEFEKKSFDTVILNSVTQLFPSIDYLKRVIENAVDVVECGGKIFIGDIRSYSLMEAYHTSVQLYRSEDNSDASQIRLDIQRAMREEEELLISPEFFYAIKHEIPRIEKVEISLKRGSYDNEISKFRYDAILYIGNKNNNIRRGSEVIEWGTNEVSIESFYRNLEKNMPKSLIVRNIPNKRLVHSMNAIKVLKLEDLLKEKRDILSQIEYISKEAIDPEEFRMISRKLPYSVQIGWSMNGGDGCFDVALEYLGENIYNRAILPEPQIEIKTWDKYANIPSLGDINRKLIQSLREFIVQRLPEYMIPSAFVVIDRIPITTNGKLDLHSLPIPEQYNFGTKSNYIAPRNAFESMIAVFMEEILGIEGIGVNDSFFELGGNSLLATQLISRIRSELNVDLPLRNLFMAPNVAGLSEKVMAELSKEISEYIEKN